MKIAKYILLVPLILIVGFLAISYHLTHGQPYDQSINEKLVPKFESVRLDFVHAHTRSSLPMLASCINDGDNDLFVARNSGVTLYTNTGGQFSGTALEIPFDEKSTPLSFAFADLNRDGSIDMFVSAYLPKAQMKGLNIFNEETYGSTSLLLLNNGDNTFRDITDKAGMRYTHNTFQGIFVDIDDDGELDLVVAHNTGQVKTWKNLADDASIPRGESAGPLRATS